MEDLVLKEVEYQSEEFDALFNQWQDDIAHFMPDFDIDDLYFSKVLVVNFMGSPIGMFIYQEKGDQIHVNLDYVTSAYRNKGIGNSVFEIMLSKFKQSGFKLIVALAYNPEHENYLLEVGFMPSESFKAQFEMRL